MLRLLLDISEDKMLALAVKVQKRYKATKREGRKKKRDRKKGYARTLKVNKREDTTTRCTERVGPRGTGRTYDERKPNHKLRRRKRLLGGGELGDRLGTFRDGVLGKLTGEDETDSRLDLSRRDGRLLVVRSKLRSLSGDALEDVLNERVKNGHGLVRDTGVGVNLLKNTVDVGGVGLLADLGGLLLVTRLGGSLGGLLGSLGGSLASGRGGGLTGGGGGLLFSGLGRHDE